MDSSYSTLVGGSSSMGGSSSKKRRDLPCDLRTVSKFLGASKSCACIQSPTQGGKALFNILLGRRRNSDQRWPFPQCAFSRDSDCPSVFFGHAQAGWCIKNAIPFGAAYTHSSTDPALAGPHTERRPCGNFPHSVEYVQRRRRLHRQRPAFLEARRSRP